MNAAGVVQQIQDVSEMLKTATQLEQQSIEDYNRWAIECGNAADAISKQLFEAVIADEERHFDQFDTELDKLAKFGEKYLVLQSMERSRSNAGGDGGTDTTSDPGQDGPGRAVEHRQPRSIRGCRSFPAPSATGIYGQP